MTIIIIIIRWQTLRDCMIYCTPGQQVISGEVSKQTEVYEIFSQFSTKFNQNLMEWPLVYMQPNLPETFMKIGPIYTLQDIHSVLRLLCRQSRDTNRTDTQTNRQTNRQTNKQR